MVGRLAGLAVVLLLWEVVGHSEAARWLIAPPSAVAGWLAAHAGLVTRATAVTVAAAALGFVAGNLAAVALAGLALALPRAERLIGALALLVFCLPLVATGPILRVLWGPGLAPQVTLAALAVYYTTFLPLLVGLRAAPAIWFDLVRSYGRGRLSELRRIRLRAARALSRRRPADRRPRRHPRRDGGRVHRGRAWPGRADHPAPSGRSTCRDLGAGDRGGGPVDPRLRGARRGRAAAAT